MPVFGEELAAEVGRRHGAPVEMMRLDWVGGMFSFGEGDGAPSVAVTMRDVRCSMVTLDPDSARPTPEVLKSVVRVNQNNAGVCGTVSRTGTLAVGQPVFLHHSA